MLCYSLLTSMRVNSCASHQPPLSRRESPAHALKFCRNYCYRVCYLVLTCLLTTLKALALVFSLHTVYTPSSEGWRCLQVSVQVSNRACRASNSDCWYRSAHDMALCTSRCSAATLKSPTAITCRHAATGHGTLGRTAKRAHRATVGLVLAHHVSLGFVQSMTWLCLWCQSLLSDGACAVPRTVNEPDLTQTAAPTNIHSLAAIPPPVCHWQSTRLSFVSTFSRRLSLLAGVLSQVCHQH